MPVARNKPMTMQPDEFLSDVPDTTDPQTPVPRVLKSELTTPHTLDASAKHKPLTSLADSIEWRRKDITNSATTVYLLIDDVTPANEQVDPILAQAYQALTKAAQLLFEARTHIYRYANKLDALEQYNAQFAEFANALNTIHQVARELDDEQIGQSIDGATGLAR